MSNPHKLMLRIQELEHRLVEAEETLRAIRCGELDAPVVSGPQGDHIYALKGADQSYRVMMQDMSEGAASLAPDGLVLYANHRLAQILRLPLERVIGSHIQDCFQGSDRQRFEALLEAALDGYGKGEVSLAAADGELVPVLLSLRRLRLDDTPAVCMVATDLTEQKRSEEIRAAENLARAILEQAAEAIVVLDGDGKIIRASQAAIELAGENILLRDCDAVLPLIVSEGGRPASRQIREAACAGHVITGVEAQVARASGQTAYVLVSASPLRVAGGQPSGCVITLTDITARKRVQIELEAAEDRRRRAIEAADTGTWYWDLLTGELIWSERCRALFGLPPDEPVSYERFIEWIHPDDRRRIGEDVDRCLHQCRAIDVEYRVVWPDGSVHWIAARGAAEADEFGTLIRMQGAVHNIDERKAVEEMLHDALATNRAIIEGSPVAIWALGSSGSITLWNPAAERLFGWSAGEVVGRRDVPAQALLSREVLDGVAAGEPVVAREATLPTKTGPSLAVMLSVSCLRDADQASRGFVALATDLTRQKQLEEQMRHTQKLESLGILAGGIAHDFNNLLTGIIGNASLLGEAVPAGAQPHLNDILDAASRAAELTRQMLAYAGKGRFFTEPLDLSALVRESTNLVRASISKKAELRLELPPGLPAIEADRSQIQQIVMNLVINASEALGDGAGTIAIRTGVREVTASETGLLDAALAAGRYIFLEVQDTGCGMPDEVKARIFDPFFTTKFTGRGLGLSAVQGIVRSYKGALRVDSAPGIGTRFLILFPAAAAGTPRLREEKPGDYIKLQGSGTVLVVDDEEVVRRIAQATLTRYGYDVVTAANGEQAVSAYAADPQRFSLILLDVKMPVMDGGEALVLLRRLQPSVKVLISSGYDEMEALRGFHDVGIAGFIQKPYRAAVLAEAVARILGGPGPRATRTSA